jgi:hypothetical protein
VITGLGSLTALAATVVYVLASGGRLAAPGAVLGGVGLVLLAVGLVLRWPMTIPWAILLAGGGYLAAREGRAAVDGWAAVFGVVLLLSAELAAWSIEHDSRVSAERSLVLRRVATLAGLTAAALLVNFILLGTAGLAASASVLLAAVGVAAAVASVAVVLRLLRP